MGNCCGSGGRDAAFDQKEHQLTSPELKKEDGQTAEKAAKPVVESPEDITFKETARQLKSHVENTNVCFSVVLK